MKLFENPIFLTQQRLARRAGLLAPILIAALIGLSLLSGLVAYLSYPHNFGFLSPQQAGKAFYAWTVGIEILVLVIGAFSRISRVLAEDRKAGLWDSNRLTPMQPSEIVTGYWLGAPLREFWMAAVLAVIGLPIVLLAHLPLTLWLGSQVLILATALFFGLLAALIGMSMQKPQSGLLILPIFFFFQMFSFSLPRITITNFLLPVFAIVNLFSEPEKNTYDWNDWNSPPVVFGLPVPAIILSLGLQFVLGIFLWRAAVRKTANPFQPLLLRWEAIAIFALLATVQHGLMWGIWAGNFNHPAVSSHYQGRYDSLLSVVHAGTMFAGMLILAFASPQPEHVRVEALRAGGGNLRLVFSRSAVLLAGALAAVAGLASLTHFVFSFSTNGIAWALAVGNLLTFFLMFSLLLEFCRLRHKRRAVGFAALWLFVLCLLPFILAGVFSNEALLKISFLAPGVAVLSNPDVADQKYLAGMVFLHLAIVALLFGMWRRQWLKLLRPNPPAA